MRYPYFSFNGFTKRTVIAAVAALIVALPSLSLGEELPDYLKDRGTGVYTSLFGTYVKGGQFLFYPFYEYVTTSNVEYQGDEFGFPDNVEYIGESEEHEVLLFFAYGITDDIAVELEGAVWTKQHLDKDPNDTSSGLPSRLEEDGLGDVESQIRWRLLRENESRPEVYCNFEAVFPLQKDKVLIGTQDWEFALGLGAAKGFSWGTLTPRISVEYERLEEEWAFGEYAIEYLKRLSPEWRWVTTLEGEEDEVSIIVEAQWFVHERAFVKLNNGFGLSELAPDFAPEVGIMFNF